MSSHEQFSGNEKPKRQRRFSRFFQGVVDGLVDKAFERNATLREMSDQVGRAATGITVAAAEQSVDHEWLVSEGKRIWNAIQQPEVLMQKMLANNTNQAAKQHHGSEEVKQAAQVAKDSAVLGLNAVLHAQEGHGVFAETLRGNDGRAATRVKCGYGDGETWRPDSSSKIVGFTNSQDVTITLDRWADASKSLVSVADTPQGRIMTAEVTEEEIHCLTHHSKSPEAIAAAQKLMPFAPLIEGATQLQVPESPTHWQ